MYCPVKTVFFLTTLCVLILKIEDFCFKVLRWADFQFKSLCENTRITQHALKVSEPSNWTLYKQKGGGGELGRTRVIIALEKGQLVRTRVIIALEKGLVRTRVIIVLKKGQLGRTRVIIVLKKDN